MNSGPSATFGPLKLKPFRAAVVVDLGFGDAGKGLLTDFLVRRMEADLVVRFNGGAQAGHNVVCADGRHHTFAQFGAGSFINGVRTILSRHVVIHPTGLLLEGEALRKKGMPDIFSRILASEQSLLITPFHQAAGRLRELARGDSPHGSCGIGLGEAVKDSIAAPNDAVRAGDLYDLPRLRGKLFRMKERMWNEVRLFASGRMDAKEMSSESAIFERADAMQQWIDASLCMAKLGVVAPESALARWMKEAKGVVFEGAQGVLLDESRGFHPHTTWSRCTFDNAMEIFSEVAPDEHIKRVGVLRAYVVRHGPGPLPTEDEGLRPAVLEHNRFGKWQGRVRYGWFDGVLADYAMRSAGPFDLLAMTHLDVPARLKRWKLCNGYKISSGSLPEDLQMESLHSGTIRSLAVVKEPSLARQERLTDLLSKAEPCYRECAANEASVIRFTEEMLSRDIDIISRGPSALDVETTWPL